MLLVDLIERIGTIHVGRLPFLVPTQYICLIRSEPDSTTLCLFSGTSGESTVITFDGSIVQSLVTTFLFFLCKDTLTELERDTIFVQGLTFHTCDGEIQVSVLLDHKVVHIITGILAEYFISRDNLTGDEDVLTLVTCELIPLETVDVYYVLHRCILHIHRVYYTQVESKGNPPISTEFFRHIFVGMLCIWTV